IPCAPAEQRREWGECGEIFSHAHVSGRKTGLNVGIRVLNTEMSEFDYDAYELDSTWRACTHRERRVVQSVADYFGLTANQAQYSSSQERFARHLRECTLNCSWLTKHWRESYTNRTRLVGHWHLSLVTQQGSQ